MAISHIKPAQVSLPSDTEVRVSRDFAAPRQLVWDAHTVPELVRRWMLGPPGWSMPLCEMDVREGGKYRWRWRSDDTGAEFGFFGAFLVVHAPVRMTYEQFYDPGDLPADMDTDNPAIIHASFTENNGVTRLETVIRFASKQIRDTAISTGMTDGMEMGYERLDMLFAAEKAG